MVKWLRRTSVILLGVLLLMIGLRVAGRPPDPEYNGDRLSEILGGVGISSHLQDTAHADWVLVQMGESAVPYLVHQLSRRDSRTWNSFVIFLEEKDWNWFGFWPSDERKIQALIACKILGDDAASALPAITKLLSESPDYAVRRNAALALGGIGPSAAPAVPQLIAVLQNDPEPWVRQEAARALGKIGPAASIAVPQLMESVRKGSTVYVVGGYAGLPPVTNNAAADAIQAIRALTNSSVGIAAEAGE